MPRPKAPGYHATVAPFPRTLPSKGAVAWSGRGDVHDLRHHGQGPNRAGADARHEQQIGEVLWPAIRRRGERAVQAAEYHVLWADVVMVGHDQVREHRL